MASGVNIAVSEDLVRPLVEEKIKAAMLEALGDQGKIIEALVDRVLATKVNRHGEIGDCYDSKYTLLDVTLHQSVKEAIEESFKEWVFEHKTQIREAVEVALATKKTQKTVAAQLINAFTELSANALRIDLDVKLPQVD